MEKTRAIDILKRQIEEIAPLRRRPSGSPEFKKWHRDTEIAIERIFGKGRHIKDFNSIGYSLMAFSSSTPDSAFEEAYREGLEGARAVLESMIAEASEYWNEEGKEKEETPRDPVGAVRTICERFHLVARRMRSRREGRPGFEVEDEYDVQDLLHALLFLHFDDIRPEEWTPSYAGGAARMDFLLKAEQVVVEAKRTRKGLDARTVGDALLVDTQRYRAHPDCRTLVCFIYDPEGRLANPRGLENDLSGAKDGLAVVCIVAPKGT